MIEIIERMLQVEEEARGILAEAEKRAGEIAEECRREADGKSEKLRSDAHVEASKKIEETRRKLDEKRKARLAEVDRENETWAEGVRARTSEAVDLVVKRVIGG